MALQRSLKLKNTPQTVALQSSVQHAFGTEQQVNRKGNCILPGDTHKGQSRQTGGVYPDDKIKAQVNVVE